MFKALLKIVAFLVLALILGGVLSPFINLLLYWLLQPLRWLGLPERLLSDLRLTGKFEWVTTQFSFVPALLIASLVMTRFEHRPIASLGLSLHPGWLKEFALGIILACVAVIPASLLLHFLAPYIPIQSPTHEMEMKDPRTYISTPADWFTVGIVLALLILFLAAFEELIFRGYLFQTLMAAIGQWPTILATSSIFAVVHFVTHGVSAIIAAGILGWIMALLYLRSRSLWIAVGFHAGANGLFAVPVVLGLIFLTREVGENWLYPGIIGVIALILALWTLKYLKPSAEMEALWQQHVPIAQPWAQLRAWWARRKNKPTDVS